MVRVSLTEDQHRLWDRGVALSKEGRLEEAQAEFDMLADILPSSAPVWLAKGINLNYLHRYEEALAAVEHGLTLDASSGPGWCAKGNALCGLKRFDEAAFAYVNALPLGGDTAAILRAIVRAFLWDERPAKALVVLDQLEQVTPGDAIVWHYRATAYYSLGKYEEALEAIEKALEIGAGERELDARLVQGNAQFMLGHDEEALAAYEQAIRLHPKDLLGWKGKLLVLRRGRRWRALWQGIWQVLAMTLRH